MDADPLAAGRSHVEQRPDGLLIAIPNRRNWFVIAFLFVWATLWTIGSIGSGDALGYALGAAGCAFAVGTIAWMLFGRQEVEAANGRLVVRRVIGPLRRERVFDASRVEDVRVSGEARPWWAMHDSFGFSDPGTIRFDYGARTHRFAAGIDEAEAKQLVPRIREALG